jgi:sugar phosphate isomerase/epimerase
MNPSRLSRRKALTQTGLIAGAAVSSRSLGLAAMQAKPPAPETGCPFRYCLNTATIRGHKLGIVKEVEVAARAGYDAIEPWIDSIGEYARSGGDLSDLRKRINDSGLTVEGAIGFAEWIVDDETRRLAALERARREMDLVAQIGGKRIAAPPAGATGLPALDLAKTAERYRALLEAGEPLGVVPQLELWGFSKNLGRLGECVCVAMESGHRNACVLADVYHLHKGGSEFHGLQLLGPRTVQVLHLNDYPSDPPRDTITDSYRVYPGDGVAPLTELLRVLRGTGGQKVLSLELFHRQPSPEDALTVARTGLAKMRDVVSRV